jgi:hypothetical protein
MTKNESRVYTQEPTRQERLDTAFNPVRVMLITAAIGSSAWLTSLLEHGTRRVNISKMTLGGLTVTKEELSQRESNNHPRIFDLRCYENQFLYSQLVYLIKAAELLHKEANNNTDAYFSELQRIKAKSNYTGYFVIRIEKYTHAELVQFLHSSFEGHPKITDKYCYINVGFVLSGQVKIIIEDKIIELQTE